MSELMKNKKFNNRNYDLKAYMQRKHVSYKDIGDHVGLSARTIQRRLNEDLSEEDTKAFIEMINELSLS